MTLAFPTFTAGMVLSMSLIMAIGPQNAHVLRMGLQRQHLWLTVAVCALADIVLISLGVFGLAQLGGLSDKLLGALIGAGVLFLGVYAVALGAIIDSRATGTPFSLAISAPWGAGKTSLAKLVEEELEQRTRLARKMPRVCCRWPTGSRATTRRGPAMRCFATGTPSWSAMSRASASRTARPSKAI